MIANKHIDIVSFDIPYPANYGGIIDVYNRALALKNAGWTVTLHCFKYNRPSQPELDKLFTVKYYKRNTSFWQHLSFVPYIAKSRFNASLLANLKTAKGVILLEGLHCTSYLKALPNRCYVRAHNVEHHYYQDLATHAHGMEKWFFKIEALKLKYFESILHRAKGILTISENDHHYFSKRFEQVHMVPPVIRQRPSKSETEPFVLFTGNLSVAENIEAVKWLAQNVVSQLPEVKFKFAGRNPYPEVRSLLESTTTELIENPNETEMLKLQQKARVHMLYSPQKTGFKLKLIEAMGQSGYVICNENFNVIAGLKEVVSIKDHPEDIINALQKMLVQPPSSDLIERRHQFLEANFGEAKIVDHLASVFQLQ